MKEANREIADYISEHHDLVFIDTFPGLLDKEGKPRPELYVKDRLHMNAKGYAIWKSIIGPYLDRAD